MKHITVPMLVILCCVFPFTGFTQSTGGIDYNAYYQYPFSAGALYQPLSGLGNRDLADFSINEISGEVRIPLPGLPVLQPLLRGGVITSSYLGDENQDWTHTHIYAAPGIGYVTRVSREFEIGADLFAGVSQSFFTNLVFEGEPIEMGQRNLILGFSGRLALDPSYNISVSVTPTIRYLYGLGQLHTYDGFTFGAGFSVSYRFGQDPDAVQSTVRALRFGNTSLPPLFSAMQSYYSQKPAGTITITNAEKYTVSDLELSFMQSGFMDSPTPLLRDTVLEPGQSIEVPVLATFNNQIFSTQGTTPLTGEIIAAYTARGRQVEQKQSISYELYDRNSLTWDDDRKVAAFITPADSALRNYSSFIRQAHRDLSYRGLSTKLQFALEAYNALSVLGILYQIDPTSPFTSAQEDPMVIDSISFPRETLKRLTGDCDDITVLYCSLLESVGIETALVTVPGHIYCAFNTGLGVKDSEMIHPDRTMTIELDGSLWVPVEITLIGKDDFLKAWETGIAEFRHYDGQPGARGFYPTAEAQRLFRPVALRETDLGLQYGNSERLVQSSRDTLNQLITMIMKPRAEEAREKNTARSWNSFGISAAQLGEHSQAEEAFKRAIGMERSYMPPKINLGSLYFLEENYDAALKAFLDIETMVKRGQYDPSKKTIFTLYLNISRTAYALQDWEKAKDYFELAQSINPTAVEGYAHLGTGKAVETGRASGAAGTDGILFDDGEEQR